MNGWMLLWKATFIIGVALFAGMSVWVTVAGFGDIKRLFAKLDANHRDEQGKE